MFFSFGYSFASSITLLLADVLAKLPVCPAEVLSAGWCRGCFPPVLEAWDTPLLSPNPPYLRISLPSLLLGALGGHPAAGLPPHFWARPSCLQAWRLGSLRLSTAAGISFRMQGSTPLPLPELLSSVPCGASGSCPGGAGGLEQAWGRSPGASPGACISAEQPGGRANKYQTFSGEINYPPAARENSRYKLSC